MLLATVTPDLPDELAHDWFGLGTWAIIAIAVVISVIGWRKLRRDSNIIKDQVLNSHEKAPPLRVDLDQKFERIYDRFAQLYADIKVEQSQRQDAINGVNERLDEVVDLLRNRHDGE